MVVSFTQRGFNVAGVPYSHALVKKLGFAVVKEGAIN